jgi:hypothetical protein
LVDLVRIAWNLCASISNVPLANWREKNLIQEAPPLVYLLAPALRFHPVTGIVLEALSPQIEVVRVGLTESWRRGIRVVMRQ